MIALALIAVFVWIGSSVGQVVIARLGVLRDHPLERWVYGTALGLGIAAYAVLGLGLMGQLALGPVAALWAVLAVSAIRGMKIQARDLHRWFDRTRRRPGSADTGESAGTGKSAGRARIERVCVVGLLIMAVIGVASCFRPPGAIEWDALAYHLADPKIYIQQHRISILPTQHHSNFPFMIEMLFTIGLLFQGAVLANLFHFVYAVLTAFALISFAKRALDPPSGYLSGYLAAVLYATTPLVIWEASVAYIDVGAALYTTLACFAVLTVCEMRSSERLKAPPKDGAIVSDAAGIGDMRAWLVLAGMIMGLALGVKYLALIPFVLFTGLLLLRRVPLKRVGLYVGVASAVGSPWYIKNVVWMHNPVYPFYYRAFPQTRYWSLDREVSYRSEQGHFGFPHSPGQPRAALLNLLESPWRLVANAERYYNPGEVTFCIWVGGLYAGFLLCLALIGRLPRIVRDLGLLMGLQFVAWFFLAQIGRYILQFLPIAALLAGYAAYRISNETGPKSLFPIVGWRSLVGALIGGQFLYVVWSLCTLPTGGPEAVELQSRTGLLPTSVSVPEALADASNPDSAEATLHNRLGVYAAEQWINRNTPTSARVILYDETLGYYLDRSYLWGNEKHSSYIPYERFADGAALTAWFRQHGFAYAFIDLIWSPKNQGHRPMSPDEALGDLQTWYEDPAGAPERWSRLVGDALRQGLWQVVDVEHGCVVLKIDGAGQATPARVNVRREN